MRDISIINPGLNPDVFRGDLAKTSKVIALIDPVVNNILMAECVAEIRALRGFGPRSQGLPRGPLHSLRDYNMTTLSDTWEKKSTKGVNVGDGGQGYIERRGKVEESQRQIAEINISHDGDTAVAVCLALDQPEPDKTEEAIIDNGHFDPIHEPEWGDEGWFSNDDYTKSIPENKLSTYP